MVWTDTKIDTGSLTADEYNAMTTYIRSAISGTGAIDVNIFKISGTEVNASAAELNYVSGVSSSLQVQINSVSGGLISLSGNVVSLSGNNYYQGSLITSLSGNVVTLSGAVVTTNSNLSALSGNVLTLSGNVVTLSGGLVTANGNINSVSGNYVSLSGALVSTNGNVSTLSGTLVTTNSNLTSLSGNIVSLSGNLTSLSGTVVTQTSRLTTVSGAGYTNTSNVSTLSGNIVSLSGVVNSLSGNIVSLSGNSVSLQSQINEMMPFVLSNPGSSSIGSFTGILKYDLAQVDLVVGDVCYLASGTVFAKAVGTAEATTKGMLAMSTGTIGSNTSGLFLLHGLMRFDSWTWTATNELYVAEVAGSPTATKPSSSGDVIRKIGYAYDVDTIYFHPSENYIILS